MAMAKAKATLRTFTQTITTRLTYNGACGSMTYGLASTHTYTHVHTVGGGSTTSNWTGRTPIRIRNRARFAHLNLYRNLI